MSEIIPFGKYKGQPVEVLQHDPAYVDWLRNQQWFVERFANIHTLIINNFGESAETPEHNALQARFLNDSYTLRILHTAGLLEPWTHSFCGGCYQLTIPRVYEEHGIDVLVGKVVAFLTQDSFQELARYEEHPDAVEWLENISDRNKRKKFEFPDLSGGTVLLAGASIELKPSLGDDYPAVKRAIQSRRKRRAYEIAQRCYDRQAARRLEAEIARSLAPELLVTEKYVGKAVPFHQVAEIFSSSDIRVLNLEFGLSDLPPAETDIWATGAGKQVSSWWHRLQTIAGETNT